MVSVVDWSLRSIFPDSVYGQALDQVVELCRERSSKELRQELRVALTQLEEVPQVVFTAMTKLIDAVQIFLGEDIAPL